MINEQAIIKYLKENKYKGVAFGFMPQDVKDWCLKHRFDKFLNVFDDDAWIVPDSALLCYSSDIYCLPEDYEPKHEFKHDWEEFKIDEDGYFEFNGKKYYYREDARFETENRDKFKGFGGWLCADGKWRTYPVLYEEIGDNACFGGVGGCDCEPAVGTKIRFWRYKK